MMTNTEFVAKLKDVAENYKTVYMWGAIGSPVSEPIIANRAAAYPSWYTAARQASFRALIGQGYFAFDCVNLAKSVLWGWNGDASKTYGGAKYASNGVPDVSADTMIQLCQSVTTNFKANIPTGAALWISGHFGVYIGEGLAAECTPKWKNGVQITAVGNIGAKTGCESRKWTKWGLLPYVSYVSGEVDEETKIAISKLNALGIIDPPEYWLTNTPRDQYLDDLLRKAAAKITTRSAPCATAEAAISALVRAGVISTPKYWLKHYGDIKYLDELLKELGGCV